MIGWVIAAIFAGLFAIVAWILNLVLTGAVINIDKNLTRYLNRNDGGEVYKTFSNDGSTSKNEGHPIV